MKKVLLSLFASAAALAIAPAAMANTVDIGFSCNDGNGTLNASFGSLNNGTSACKNSTTTAYTSPEGFTQWTQGGFSVNFNSSTAANWLFNPNQGDSKPGTTDLTLTAGSTASLTVTDSGKPFDFDGVNIGGNSGTGKLNYTITGFLNGDQKFQLTGVLCSSAAGSLGTCTNQGSPAQAQYYFINGNYVHIDSLQIDIKDASGSNNGAYLDNIQVTETPEPGSLALLGTGLLGLAMMLRRVVA